jgi:predicted S18 family serine protease
MAEILSYDPAGDPEVVGAMEADQAESLAIGEEMINQANARLAGKYKDAQELERAYIELEKKLGSRDGQEEETAESEPQDQQEERTEYSPQIEAISRAAEEFNSKGELSAETLAQFEQMSSKELVQAYFEYEQGLPAMDAPQSVELSQGDINTIQNSVGGEAAYQQLVGWAAQNFSEAEIQAFDNVVDSGNVAAINLALAGLKARYTDANGYEGNMIQGKAAAPADTFKSQAEVVRAMSDPKYDRDPAYRDEIMQKLARSDLKF